jgi:hypothetical protein
MLKLTKARPDDVFALLDAVSALGPCTIDQIRGFLKAQWPPVRSARTFAESYGLAESGDNLIRLTPLAKRLLRYVDEKRVEFVLRHWRLQDIEPFQFLREQLSQQDTPIKMADLADSVRIKFLPDEQWTRDERQAFADALGSWLEYLHLVEKEGSAVRYIGGNIVTPSVFALLEVEFLRERELRDWFVEGFANPRSIVDSCREILGKIALEKDDQERGNLLHEFIFETGKRLGFSPRMRNSPHEGTARVSFETAKGGGDVVLFFHHPVESRSITFQGGALACEAKSTEGNIGSKAVGQARNLASKVREAFPEYFVYPAIISRSTIGYDGSGLDLAPPEVVHLTSEGLIALLEIQRSQFSAGGRLILPPHIFAVLDEFTKNDNLQPTPEQLSGTTKKTLEA